MRYTYLKGKSTAKSMAVFGGSLHVRWRCRCVHGTGVCDGTCFRNQVYLDERTGWLWCGIGLWCEEGSHGAWVFVEWFSSPRVWVVSVLRHLELSSICFYFSAHGCSFVCVYCRMVFICIDSNNHSILKEVDYTMLECDSSPRPYTHTRPAH